MALAYVPLSIDQGEDWTAQVILTDQDGNSLSLDSPMQMDLKNVAGSLVLSLHTLTENEEILYGNIPEITFSSDIGLIQLHIAKEVTKNLPVGSYNYDLFASVNDGDIYAGSQVIRVLAGQAQVNKRVTVM